MFILKCYISAPPTVCPYGMEEDKISGTPSIRQLREESVYEVSANTKKDVIVDIQVSPKSDEVYILTPVSLDVYVLISL